MIEFPGNFSRHGTGIVIVPFLAILVITTARCSPAALKPALPPSAKAAWEGRWKSCISNDSGGITALFPDPIPRGSAFVVEVTVSYGEGAERAITSLTTVMAGEFDEGTGTLRFRGSLAESGQVVEYAAVPDRNFTEFSGDYTSHRPDDRGTFYIRKNPKAIPAAMQTGHRQLIP